MKKLFSLVLAMLMILSVCPTLAESINYDVTEPTKVIFWHTLNDEDDVKLLDKIVADFNAANEGLITVEPVFMTSYNNINTNLASANVAGVDVPGCAFINVPRLKAYADSGLIENLNPYIEHYGVDMTDFVQGFLDAMAVDGAQVALPIMQSGQVAYYNADLLKELNLTFPTKWEEMPAYLEAVYAATGKPVITIPVWDNAYFYPIYSNLNASMINIAEDGKETTGLDTEEALAVTKEMREWTDKGWISWADDSSTCRAAFTSGDVGGIMLYTTANYNNLQSKADFTVGIAVPPAMATGKNCQLVAGGTFILPTNNTQQVKNAAFKFMVHFTSAQYTLAFATATSYMPTHLSALEDAEGMKAYYEVLPAMTSVIENLTAFEKKPQSAYFDSCGNIFESYIGQIMIEKIDVEEGWEMMIEEMNEYLADQE